MFAGGNSTFSLSIINVGSPQSSAFSLSLKLVGELDRESVAEYYLEVFATDGKPKDNIRYNATLSVTVIVKDENDNEPVFDISYYHAEFILPVEVGTELIQVNATDSDTGDNGRITYYIENNEQFFVHPDSGKIQLAKKISSSSGNFTVDITVYA